jgi:putative transposase
MKRVFRVARKGKVKPIVLSTLSAPEDLDAKLALIQALIPLGLLAVAEALKEEVLALAGERYSRKGGLPGLVRWSQQRGSVCLGDQRISITYPRVRDRASNQEIPLQTYRHLQQPHATDGALLLKILRGLSCRSYGECAEAIPAAFGMSPSSVSRRFIRVSARKLQQLCERRLESYDFVALFLDGKTFAEDEMLIALLSAPACAVSTADRCNAQGGITLSGEKVILGFIQTGTENERVCSDFLRSLLDRGLQMDPGLLCIIDGAKGLRAAIQRVFGSQALIQRCHLSACNAQAEWHKRENVVSYLPKSQQALWRRKLQAAYEKPTYTEAQAALQRCRQELRLLNVSAVASLDEGMEETLTLHRLGVFPQLGLSLKTTNCLESLMAQVGQRTDKVDRWRNSDQKQRWVASALLDIEPRLRRVKGYRHLPTLRAALQGTIRGEKTATGDQVA